MVKNAQATSNTGHGDGNSSSLTVLLCEDDQALRQSLAEVLESAGFLVIEAADGKEMIGHLARSHVHRDRVAAPDVVVADVRMPFFLGTDVVRTLRSYDRQTPVVLISAFAGVALERTASELNVSAILSKPFDVTRLLDAVRSAIEGNERLKEPV